MNTEAHILTTITALNVHLTGAERLVPEVHGHTDSGGFREFFAVCDLAGRVAACGYFESELLADLMGQLTQQRRQLEALAVGYFKQNPVPRVRLVNLEQQ